MLGREAPHGRDGVDDRDRPLERKALVDPDLLRDLAPKSVHEALSGVDAAPGQEPVLLAGLLVATEQNAPAPAKHRRHPDPRLSAHAPDDPKPPAPRSVAGSSSTSTRRVWATARTTSCATRMPGSTRNASAASVFKSVTSTSPR